MAKKITIAFSSNPTVGDAFHYDIRIGLVNIVYGSGLNSINLNYISGGNNSAPYGIGIMPTLSGTIDKTLQVLNEIYYNDAIFYKREGDTIEVYVNIEDTTIEIYTDQSAQLTLTQEDIAFNENYFTKYLIQYYDVENVPIEVRILKQNYTGLVTTVGGKATLTKGSVKNNLDPIRGSGLDLELEADTNLTFEDLYTDDERTYKVTMKRNFITVFNGFLKPDGIFQSFVTDAWIMNISCVDGLGFLDNLAFVKTNGLQFTGFQSGIEIIYNCLKRTGTTLPINTAVNVYYKGLTPSDTLDPLAQMNVSVSRFVKDDDTTIMNCQEVLSSILNLFSANITQYNNEWYIYRANEVSANPIQKFRRYNGVTGVYSNLKTMDLGFTLGSQINNFYPHHCSANQQIEIKGVTSAYRLNYKYGFLKGLIKNPTFNHVGLDYPNWDLGDFSKIITDPLLNNWLIVKNLDFVMTPVLTTESLGLFVKGQRLQFTVTYDSVTSNNSLTTYFRIKLKENLPSINEWTYESNSTSRAWFLNADKRISIENTSGTFEVDINELPADGELTITVFASKAPTPVNKPTGTTTFKFLNLVSVDNNKKGEFHTAQRKTRPSSIAKETETIYNGDSPSIIYEGAIYKADKTTPTGTWFRRGVIEDYPILRIAVEDVVRMQQLPARLFSGSAYGYIPYLSRFQIDNVQGNYQFIEWSFDSYQNITTFKALQAYSDELSDIDYKLTFDFGNTVKPTINY